MGRSTRRGVETRALIADHEPRLVRAVGDQEPDPAVAVRGQGGPLPDQRLESSIVLLAEIGAHLEVAVEQGIPHRLVQRRS